jgi:hypothetical protein
MVCRFRLGFGSFVASMALTVLACGKITGFDDFTVAEGVAGTSGSGGGGEGGTGGPGSGGASGAAAGSAGSGAAAGSAGSAGSGGSLFYEFDVVVMADAHILSNEPSTNHGSTTVIDVSHQSWTPSGGVPSCRKGYLLFDLSDVLANGIIEKIVSLRYVARNQSRAMYFWLITGEGVNDWLEVDDATDPSKLGITWNNAPGNHMDGISPSADPYRDFAPYPGETTTKIGLADGEVSGIPKTLTFGVSGFDDGPDLLLAALLDPKGNGKLTMGVSYQGSIARAGLSSREYGLIGNEQPPGDEAAYLTIRGLPNRHWPIGVLPANAATVDVEQQLIWSQHESVKARDVTYRVWLGTEPSNLAMIHETQPGDEPPFGCNPGTLVPNTTYHWRVDAIVGTTVHVGPSFRFTTNARAFVP